MDNIYIHIWSEVGNRSLFSSMSVWETIECCEVGLVVQWPQCVCHKDDYSLFYVFTRRFLWNYPCLFTVGHVHGFLCLSISLITHSRAKEKKKLSLSLFLFLSFFSFTSLYWWILVHPPSHDMLFCTLFQSSPFLGVRVNFFLAFGQKIC